ncbi:MAG: hypothetical protein JXR94_13240, partial [Candidatus Hydrogenedentes bacterium]|nr:hypothetical protein [Candidatus Hydrogenedentota bacterium]
MALRILGCCVAVRADRAEALSGVRRRFACFEVERPIAEAPDVEVCVRREGAGWRAEVVGREGSAKVDDEWPTLTNMIESLVQQRVPQVRMCHGASVLGEKGAAVFLGQSTSGKTTLALALQKRGLTLLGEDIVPIHLESASVFPFPTPPTLRAYTKRLFDTKGRRLRVSTSGRPDLQNAFPISVMFFLETAQQPGTPRVDLRDRLRRWDSMHALCVGHSPRGNPCRTSAIVQQDERCFMDGPRLANCPG